MACCAAKRRLKLGGGSILFTQRQVCSVLNEIGGGSGLNWQAMLERSQVTGSLYPPDILVYTNRKQLKRRITMKKEGFPL